jgi:pimeloyl-ACP methyl ester carboxylesterase
MSTREPITIPHDDAVLAGVLLHPSAPCRAAVVLLPGHGTRTSNIDACGTFDYLLPIGVALAASGIAVINYARPGTGGSSGDWRHQTLYDRADECLAVLARLRAGYPGVPCGIIGHSNGGWVAPLAASLCDRIAFAVMLAGPLVSVAEQGRFAFENSLHGPPEADARARAAFARGVAVIRLILAGRRTEFVRARQALLDDGDLPAFLAKEAALFPTWNERPAVLASMDAMIDYDPLPVLGRVTCPVLAIFGGADRVVDSAQSARLFATVRLHPASAAIVVDGADHGVGTDPTGAGFAALVTWLERVVAGGV